MIDGSHSAGRAAGCLLVLSCRTTRAASIDQTAEPRLSWPAAGAAQGAEAWLVDLVADPSCCLDQLVKVVAGREASAFQHIDQVLGGDVAGRTGREGAAADAAGGGVEDVDPGLDPGVGVGQAGVAGVVEMQAQGGVGGGLAGGLDFSRHAPRIADADGVGQGDLLDAEGGDAGDQIADLLHRDLAVEGAAPDAGQGGGQPGRRAGRAFCITTARHDVRQHLHLLVDAQSLVLQAEAVGGGHGDIDLVHRRAQRPIISLAVQNEADAAATRLIGKSGHDLFGAGHLGHVFGMDEADGLDPFRACRFEATDEVGADQRLQHRLFVLQAVAGADLDDLDEATHQRALRSPAPAGA